ncbi:flagellar FlbD family protein [Geotalea uraniireducens]|uniref:Flagellar FlbD family protein n=1 Tax=Geotalea uraniireducens (strain Rf4) TaxID=351605 RepID=A5G8V3_GEOUR|nr:flagellar FlbD family protein [Geotalea uraniireducens]ABQ28221.1 flagellar FlbD family protein [Geotalea uraniireducens Rf4]
MIRLTRLDGSELFINPDLIETIEETPDTHIALLNGNRYLVLEPTRIIIDRIVAFKAKIQRRCLSGIEKKYLRKQSGDNYRPVCIL